MNAVKSSSFGQKKNSKKKRNSKKIVKTNRSSAEFKVKKSKIYNKISGIF